MTRRTLLLASGAAVAGGLDRRAVVRRHNPVLRALDAHSPLSVGNGEFAFSADITGLQTFAGLYEKTIPLCTQSQWGWHSFPIPDGLRPDGLRLEMFETYGRQVGYATSDKGQAPLFNWLRENPHRLNLARIGLLVDGRQPELSDLSAIEQKLDLWTGILESRFELLGATVIVLTACHPDRDALVVSIRSPLVDAGRLAAAFEFPYGSTGMNASDWMSSARHQTRLLHHGPRWADVERVLDADRYHVRFQWDGNAALRQQGDHRLILSGSQLGFVAEFAPKKLREGHSTASQVLSASASHWTRFWSTGGAVDLSGRTDPSAQELERRIVLSQYLTAIQCAGSAPSQETGLTCNSWYGKFHLEMHWWHAAHFALWGRTALLERSLGWYSSILPVAREKARRQGYRGARWPSFAIVHIQTAPHHTSALSRCGVGVGGIHGQLCGGAERAICFGTASDSRAGESSTARDLESGV